MPASAAADKPEAAKAKSGNAEGRAHDAPGSATAATRQFDPPAEPAPENPLPPPGPGGSTVDGPPQTTPVGPIRGFDPASSVEVAEKRRNDTRVFANADGTFTADIHSRPIHFRDETGKWRDLDSTLLVTPTGRARNAAGPLDITVAAAANDPALARIVTETGKVFGYGLAGASGAALSVDRSDALYRDALPHTDVRLTVRDNGVKEDLILKSPDAPRRFVFPLQLDGLTASIDPESGSIALWEADGTVTLRIPRGFMEDSNYDPRSDEAPKSDGVHYALISDGAGGTALEVTLDSAWLDDPARVYPVTVDPSTADYITGQDDTYVATNQTFNGASSTELKVGTHDATAGCAGNSSPGCGGAHFHQSYLHFNGADALDGYRVLSAQLNIYEIWSYSCAARGMGVYRVTEGWGPMTNYPGATFDPNVKAWAAFAMGYSAACPAGNASFNITEFVDKWSRNDYPNYGLTLRVDPGSENDVYAWKKFASFDNNVSTDPYIRATYTPYNATYQCVSPCQWSSNVTPSSYGTLPITVTNTGRDTWPAGGAYRLSYHVLASDNTTLLQWDGARTFLPVSVAPNQSVTLQALVAPLAAGSYRLHFDMVHEGGAWYSNESVPKLDVPVTVYNPSPTISAVAPLASVTSGSLTPTLAVIASNNNPSYGGLSYVYKVCADSAMAVGCETSSGATTAWTVPANKLEWAKTYYWTVKVTDGAGLASVTAPIPLTTSPTQPTTSLHLGADPYSSGLGGVSPTNGNFATTTTDVAPSTAGPFLSLSRTYNSQDPRVLPFGTGWSTSFDMRADADPDGAIVVSYPDGHQVRFGRNPNGTYAAGPGNGAVLTGTLASGLTLTDAGGVRYTFSTTGKLTQIADANGLALNLTYNASGQLTTATSASSGRKLNFTWTGNHVTSVTTDAVAANAGAPYKWDYIYDGDRLAQACNAMNTGPRCTVYGTQSVTTPKTSTPYAKAVLADAPKGYWRMDDTGSTMADSSGNALNGTYTATGLTKSQPGGVPNDPNTAVNMTGTGYATAPSGFANFTGGLTIEAWVYPTANSNYSRIIDFGNGQASDNIVFYRLGTSTDLGLAVLKGSSGQYLNAPNALQLNTWQHLAVTLTADGIGTIYRNGHPVATGPVHMPNNLTRTSNFVGKSNWAGEAPWAGRLDEVAVYDHALTPDSIAAHYTQAQGPVRPTTASLLSTITLPKGNVSQTIHYAADQTVDYRKDGNLKQWSFASAIAPDTAARTTTVTDPASKTTKWKTDRHGRLVERVDELGNSRRFSYDETANSVGRLIDENGHVVSLTYDNRGSILTRTTSQSSAYANAVATDGPMAYWRLGDSSGPSAKDSSGQGRHGTYTGGYTLAQTGGLGDLDTAPSFDGTTGHVALPSGFADFTGGLTLEAWVYPTANGRYARIVDLGNGQASDNIILHRMDTTTDLGLSILRGSTGQVVSAPNALQLNVWQHVAATVTASGAATIYRNGQAVATGTIQLPNNLSRTSNFIGKSNWSADALWSGKIDEVAVYGSALASTTIAARYAQGTSTGGQTTSYEYFSDYAADVRSDNPTAYWRMGDRSGSLLYDASENGYNATRADGVVLGAQGALPTDGDSAAAFNGAAGTNATATLNMPATGVTLEAWVNLPDLARSGAFVQVGAGGNGYGFGVGSSSYDSGNPGNRLHGLYEYVRWIDTGVDLGTGWHHVVMTIAANGTATFYKDGAQVATSAGTPPNAPSTNTITVGGYTVANIPRWFNGGLDEVAVYPTVLSSSRIQSHYTKGVSTAGTDPRLGKMTAVRDARSSWRFDNTYRTRFTYDAAGHLLSKVAPPTPGWPSGRTTAYAYTAPGDLGFNGETPPPGLLKSETTARGSVTTYKYDGKGDLRETTDPVGLVATATYDELGRRTSLVEVSDSFPLGVSTTWEYDELSRVKTRTAPTATNVVTNAAHAMKTAYVYDGNGNVTDETIFDNVGGDASRHSSFTYDNSDRLLTSTNAATETTSQTYDDLGNIATKTDGRGTVTSFSYTPRGQLATRTIQNFVDDPVNPGTPRNLVLESIAYDPAGRVASTTDAVGRTTEFTYYDDDLLHKQTLKGYHEANGTTRDIVLDELAYDAAGNIITSVRNGRTTVLASYDAAGRLVSKTLGPNGLNRVTTYTYDADDNITSTSLTDGTRTEIKSVVYDAAGRVTTETVENDADDLVTVITRDKRGLVKSVKNDRNYTTTFILDELGRTTQMVQPSISYESGDGAAPLTGSPRTYFGFNTFGDQTHVKTPISTTVTKTYDALGRVTDVTYPTYTPAGGTAMTPAEHFTYDANSNVVSTVDRRSQTTSIVYDKLNRPVQVTAPKLATQPASGKIRTAYDDVGNVVSTTDVVGAVTQATYDDLNRVRTQTIVERVPTTASHTTTFAYDDSGNMTSSTNPTSDVTVMTYNEADEVTTVKNPRGYTTTITRDVAGRATTVRDPLSRREKSTYDLAGRLTKVEHFDRNYVTMGATTFGYDGAGNLTSATTPAGWTTTRAYDAANRLTSITEPISATDSMTTSFGYDRAGNRTRVTNGRGVSFYTKYQSWNLPREVIEPAGTWAQTYDSAGAVATATTPDGVTRTRTYDELGRLTQESSTGGGAAAASRTYGYNLRDLVSVNHPSGTQTFTYNDRGHVTASSGPSGNVSFLYNADGERTRRVDAAGTSNFTYDRNGNLSTAVDPATGTTATFAYDSVDQLTSVTNGTGNATRAFTYDDLGRVLTDTLSSSGGSAMASIGYGYDLNSNVTSKTTGPAGFAGAGTNTYTYDRADRLTSWTSPGSVVTNYGWDKAGNRTSAGNQTFVYDNNNRLTSEVVGGVTTATYTYTPRGTLASKTGAGAGTFTFDGFDRLTGDGARTYTYDGLDRLATAGGTPFTYAGLEKEPTGDGVATYARGPDGALFSMSKGGVGTKLFVDSRGDVTGTYMLGGTAMTDSRAYDPWGTPLASLGTTDPAVGYQGSWTDPTTGKVSMQARFYTPGMGAFASRDTFDVPVTSSAAANRYSYGLANPLKYTDPTGHVVYNEGYKISRQVELAAQGTLLVAGAGILAMAATGTTLALAGGGTLTVSAAVGGAGAALASAAVAAAPVVLAAVAVVATVYIAAKLWGHFTKPKPVDPYDGDSYGRFGVPTAMDISVMMGADSYGLAGYDDIMRALNPMYGDSTGTVPSLAELNAIFAGTAAGAGSTAGTRSGSPAKETPKNSPVPEIISIESTNPGNPLSAVEIRFSNGAVSRTFPSIPPPGKVLPQAPTVPPVAVEAIATAATGSNEVTVAAGSLDIHGQGGGGSSGPGGNPCSATPGGGGGVLTCAPLPPNEDTIDDLKDLALELLADGAGAKKGGGPPCKRGPKPWPYGPHNETIAARIQELVDQGYEHLNGGNLTEETIDIPGGGHKSKRRPDITMRAPDGSIYHENVGRTKSNGDPVKREVEALDDIERATGVRPVYTAYDRIPSC